MNYKNLLKAGSLAVASIAASTAVHAEFTMNWGPSGLPDIAPGHESNINCNRGVFLNCLLRGAGDPDRTPFLQERIRGTDGQIYYHVVVGTPETGFAQEVYIRASAPNQYTQAQAPWRDDSAQSDTGVIAPASSSMGDAFGVPVTVGTRRGPFTPFRPLDADETGVSGIGTANPNRVQMRQVLSSAGMSQDFRKDLFANKPKITQIFDTADLKSEWSVDMSAVSLNDMTQNLPMVNRMQVFSDGAPVGSGNFDMAVDSTPGFVDITAGKYRWVPCTTTTFDGRPCGPDQSGGNYEYAADSFNLFAEDWKRYRDPVANAATLRKVQ